MQESSVEKFGAVHSKVQEGHNSHRRLCGRKDGRAGYGVTARWLAQDEDPSLPPLADAEPTLIEHYGPVETDPASPMIHAST